MDALSQENFSGLNGPPLLIQTDELLSAGDANYDRRNIFHIDERVEIRLGRCTCPPAVFRARQIRKVDDIVSHLGDFAAHFFSRSQVQLDRFAHTALKDASDACLSLQDWFCPERTSWHRPRRQ